MSLSAPPPPLATDITATGATISQAFNDGDVLSQHHSSPHSSNSSVFIVIIVIASAIIVSTSIYLLIRFVSRRLNRSLSPSPTSADHVVSINDEIRVNDREHVIRFDNNGVESLPLFTLSSVNGNNAGGDCAVCLSKFEASDQLRLLPLCCHAFHALCIDTWLKTNLTCPLCRSTVNPTEVDVVYKVRSVSGGGGGVGARANRSNSFRIEIGSISRRRGQSESGRRAYSIGSYEYVLDDGYEISVDSTHRQGDYDKDSAIPEPPGEYLAADVAVGGGGSGRRNWLRDYVDRVSVSVSSRTQSFRGSGRYFTGSSRRNEAVDDFETAHGRIGEEISELFRWLSGV